MQGENIDHSFNNEFYKVSVFICLAFKNFSRPFVVFLFHLRAFARVVYSYDNQPISNNLILSIQLYDNEWCFIFSLAKHLTANP